MLCALDYAALDDISELSEPDVVEWRDAATKQEPAMHVKATPTDCWHKMLIDRSRTACGKILGAYATRDETYAGNICQEGCFSPYELNLAREISSAEAQSSAAKRRAAALAAEEDTPLSRSIAEARKRRHIERTGETAPIEKPDIDDDDDR